MNVTNVTINFVSSNDKNDKQVIEIWKGFNFGDLLKKIIENKGEEIDNECILFYKDNNYINFTNSDIVHNGEYFNVVILDKENLCSVYSR